MNGEENKNSSTHLCHLCGEPTNTFVKDYVKFPQYPNYRFFERKIPLCETCFERIQPTMKNKQTLYFWSVIFPVIEEGY